MNNMQLAKYMFDYYNIPFTNVQLFGNWAVNSFDDIVNYKKYYCLFSYDITNSEMSREDWIEQISQKSFFDIKNFIKAYDFALPFAKEDSLNCQLK